MAAKTIQPTKATQAPKSVHASAPKPSESNGTTVPRDEEKIRCLAYEKWEAAGKPGGSGFQYWLEAEQELDRK